MFNLFNGGSGLNFSNNTNHIANMNLYIYRCSIMIGNYLNIRCYNLILDRFVSLDSKNVTSNTNCGYNLCAYCDNDSISKVVPDGMLWKE